jgi:putative DNA primase/helicase
MSLSDFNDLHKARGLSVVKDQIMAAIEAGPAMNDQQPETPPAPSEAGGKGEAVDPLEKALQRYSLIHGETKIYDAHLQKVFKQAGMKATLGNDLFNAWAKAPNRKTTTWVEVNGKQAGANSNDPLLKMIDRFVYIYPTKNAWDHQRLDMVPLEALKAYLPTDYTRWMEHPRRNVIDQENVVFDPTQQANPETTINTFTGLPLIPDELAKASRYQACAGIFEMLGHLCNHDDAVVDWVLRWLAYPLQNVGAKLDTALLFHSDMQGSGKSLFFGEVMTIIYGRYASVLGQHQLESQYTDWRSRLLYAVFEEVLSRTEKHNQMGTIKHMITGSTQRIERKFVSGWEEANHMNGVFLSNEIQPFPLEPSDRRFLVVWPKHTLAVDLQARVSHELEHGGPASFYQLLLDYPLGDFSPHTKPLETTARQRIIDFSLPGFEVFFQDWKAGDLDIPYQCCTTRDLYVYYRRWCQETGNRPMTETKLITIFSSRLVKSRERYRYRGVEHQSMMLLVGDMPKDIPKMTYLGTCVTEFRYKLSNLEQE